MIWQFWVVVWGFNQPSLMCFVLKICKQHNIVILYIFILCFLTIHSKCSHISLVLVSWNSEYSCFTWNGVLAWPAWPGRHENPADGGPPSWDGRCIEDLARWNQGQLMGDETNAIPRYSKVTVLWSRSCWTSCLLFWESMRFVSSVSSVAVVMIHVLDAKYTGTFAYVKQRAPVAVSDRAIYIYIHTHCEIDQTCCFFRQVNLRRMAKPLDASYYLLHSMYSSMCGVLQLDTLVPLQGKQANQWLKPVLWINGYHRFIDARSGCGQGDQEGHRGPARSTR